MYNIRCMDLKVNHCRSSCQTYLKVLTTIISAEHGVKERQWFFVKGRLPICLKVTNIDNINGSLQMFWQPIYRVIDPSFDVNAQKMLSNFLIIITAKFLAFCFIQYILRQVEMFLLLVDLLSLPLLNAVLQTPSVFRFKLNLFTSRVSIRSFMF